MSSLKIKNLSVKDINNDTKIIDKITFKLKKNKCLGIIGESGSGKTITAKSILGLLNSNLKSSGECIFENKNILNLKEKELRKIRGQSISMIPQNSMTAFDPLYTIGYQLIEAYLENIKDNKSKAKKKVFFI